MLTKARILVLDDDPVFGSLMIRLARSRGFDASWYASLIDMGSFARIKSCDIAVIDYFLESFRGDEVAEYIDTFFAEVPVLIVSGQVIDEEQKQRWPAAIKGFMAKAHGPEAILAEAERILNRNRQLQRWQSSGSPAPELNVAL